MLCALCTDASATASDARWRVSCEILAEASTSTTSTAVRMLPTEMTTFRDVWYDPSCA
jgi:hypothetical protein